MAPTDRRLNLLLLAAHQALSSAKPGSDVHQMATSALHKLRMEAMRRSGNLTVSHARAQFSHY